MTPDNAVFIHLCGVAFCLIIGPAICALVVSLWPRNESRDYRGDKHW